MRIGRPIAPLRRRLVAARRRLPDLPAQLRRQRRRRRRRPAGHHRPPRPSRPGRPRRRRASGCRRSIRRPVATSATTSATTARSIRCSGRRPTSTGWSTEAHRRGHPGRPRPRHEPHQRPAPLVRGSSRVAPDGPYADWYLWRDPAGVRTATGRRCRPTTGCRGSAARPGRGSRAAASSTTTPSWPSSPSWTGGRPAVEAAQFEMVRRLARPRRRRLPARHVQRLPQAPGPAVQPEPARARRPGPARSTATTSTSRTCRPCIGRFRAIVDARPGRMTRRRAVRRDDRGRRRADRATATSSSTGSCSTRRGRPTRSGRRIAPARAGVRAGPLADRRPLQPRPVAARLPAGRLGRRGRPSATRSPGRPPSLLLTVRGTPFLYYGEEIGMGDVDDPARRERRPAGGARRAGLPWWDRSQVPDADAVVGRARRRVHDRPAVAAPRRRRRDAQRRGPARRPGLGAGLLPPAARPARRRQPSLQDGALRAAAGAGDPTSSPTRATTVRSRGPGRRSTSVARAAPLAASRRAGRRPAGGPLAGDRTGDVARRRIASRPAHGRRLRAPDAAPILEAGRRRSDRSASAPATMTADPRSLVLGASTCRSNS